jgi:phasin family protein
MAKPTTRPHEALDFTKVWGDFRFPGVDVESIVASQRKNLEAIVQANQLAVEGAQTVLRRQMELARESMDEFSAIFRDFVQPNGSAEDRLAKQAESSKQLIEKGLASARELAELVTKANTDTFNVISKRVTESLDEVRDYTRTRVAAE